MDDEDERLEEDFYQFLNLPRNVSTSSSYTNNVQILCDPFLRDRNQERALHHWCYST